MSQSLQSLSDIHGLPAATFSFVGSDFGEWLAGSLSLLKPGSTPLVSFNIVVSMCLVLSVMSTETSDVQWSMVSIVTEVHVSHLPVRPHQINV